VNDFELTTKKLVDISMVFRDRVEAGLARENTEIKCLPAFIPPGKRLKGNTARVLDLGGSNLRAAVVSLHGGKPVILKGPIEKAMPWKRNVPMPKEMYIGIQADLLASLDCEEECPLGYCFSYPAAATPDRDAVLIDWTKGIEVPDTRGKPVGRMLSEYIRQSCKDLKLRGITVINDTVAALFAGLTDPGEGVRIGLVAGTGTNMAAFVDTFFIPKLSGVSGLRGVIPVNLESGNFNPPHLTRWDRVVDENSESPGRQRFEKAASGLYLSRIFKAVFPDSSLDEGAGARGLIELYRENGSYKKADQSERIRQIYIRSAKLSAAALSGIAVLLTEYQGEKKVRVTAEGALFDSSLDGNTSYASIVESTCNMLLEKLGRPGVKLSIRRIPDANLIGSAIAALS
jgi:hexokinase